jgi:hypothetical protein
MKQVKGKKAKPMGPRWFWEVKASIFHYNGT